jgi:hypothetical protein
MYIMRAFAHSANAIQQQTGRVFSPPSRGGEASLARGAARHWPAKRNVVYVA